MNTLGLPWKWTQWGEVISVDSRGYHGHCHINPEGNHNAGIPNQTDVTTAKFIVKACNNHDDLVACLELAQKELAYLEKCSIITFNGDRVNVDSQLRTLINKTLEMIKDE